MIEEVELTQIGADGLGRCFENSALLMLSEIDNSMYVEGVVWNNRLHQWMLHAWVELDEKIVIDAGQGEINYIPTDMYYAIGNVRRRFKFTLDELRAEILRAGKYTNFKLTDKDLENE